MNPDAPLYESLLADGTIHPRHEITLGRYLACRKAAEKVGFMSAGTDHPDFLVAQYHYCHGNFGYTAFYMMEILAQPYDDQWSLAQHREQEDIDDATFDAILDQVGKFLEIDHPGIARAERQKEEEKWERWKTHPEERPAALFRFKPDLSRLPSRNRP